MNALRLLVYLSTAPLHSHRHCTLPSPGVIAIATTLHRLSHFRLLSRLLSHLYLSPSPSTSDICMEARAEGASELGKTVTSQKYPLKAMTEESRKTGRMTQSLGAKASKPLESSVPASAPLKRHVRAPGSLKSARATLVKSPSTSSSVSSSEKRGLQGGKGGASSGIKISPGTASKDNPGYATPPSSERSTETSSSEKEFEALNELSLECNEPDETKRGVVIREPSLFNPELQLKDLDVVNSNMALSWFNVDDHEFDDFLKSKADQNPHTMALENHTSLSTAADVSVTPSSILEGINNGYVDEYEGVIGRVYSVNMPLQDKLTIAEDKAVLEELSLKKALDVTVCSEGKDNFYKCGDGPASPEKSEAARGVKLLFKNLSRQGGRAVDAFWGWQAMTLLLPSLFVLFTLLICVDNMTEGELSMLPPPT